ncbi:pyridoxal-phosphate dependent enzyme [Halodesulfovibrio spirochaetisodalis]|uniref:Pyridoxal-5-phosphate-dependent protein subunit beta n=1 Tax=Halodesulfovibrio spirochaetisodalis TaxID=1560234 RepID=A0A1B7XI89_9BACT|nr:pyridoxal-phosphate dependent enzyme [Halodesulfovibrio spirochaetisodalis]OBQ55247.1 pyridoxal-5-phosphate-dependent protein subunit beta [Halodesulfovibrio spirochaetisodalis]
MIDLTINEEILAKNIAYCREKGITLPTFSMMQNPETIPAEIQEQLEEVGLWDIHPANLFRISWKNQPTDNGGLFGGVNHIVLPPELTGCRANIIMMVGKWFPTGAHKVGATYGCIIPGLVTGQFDPQKTKAVWPSTGNYCRGGAYISALLACKAIAILPEGMSKERFEWLNKIAGEVIATPGCESNVKEIFDKCWELRNSGEDLQIFNQFDELGNPLWHYNVTGPAIEEAASAYLGEHGKLAGYISSSGSGGTLGAGYYLKTKFPHMKVGAAEALQCPTLLQNGFGDHRIEGIGDKHIPWIHDCKNTDFTIAVDDEVPIRLLRLFNSPEGKASLAKEGVSQELLDTLNFLGISGIGNLVAAIKFAKYNELTEDDYVVSIATDSLQLYGSRLQELEEERGKYSEANAERDVELLQSITFDYTKELTYYEKKAIHNLKYFTWVEQQGKTAEELNRQWYDHEEYWTKTFAQVEELDALITAFNAKVSSR